MRVSVISASIAPQAGQIEEHPFIAAVKTASLADEERNLLTAEDASDFVTSSQCARTAKRQLRKSGRTGRVRTLDPRVPKPFAPSA